MRVRAANTSFLTALLVLGTSTACGPRSDERQDMANAAGDTARHQTGQAETGPTLITPSLEKMVNHHEGLILLAGRAQKRGVRSVATDAQKLHTKQQTEQQKMIQMLSGHSGTSVKPSLMPKHKQMSDSLERQSGKAYERGFYQDVMAHHKEGIAMVDSFLPRLSDDSVRTMAEKMRSDQEKEIEEFSRKAGTSGPDAEGGGLSQCTRSPPTRLPG